MRILVVNAHEHTREGVKLFDEFLRCINDILKNYAGIMAIDNDFFVRERNQLEDFLFDEPIGYNQIKNGRNFDQLDIVLISGESYINPWSKNMFQVYVLLKMCITVKKRVFASGFAMQALVYHAASNIERLIHIINGHGNGTTLEQIKDHFISKHDYQPNHYCLDNVTGDLYSYRHENEAWAPVTNTGLHFHKNVMSNRQIGKFIQNKKIYRPKKGDDVKSYIILNEDTESLVYIKKHLLSHWLFQDCKEEFLSPHTSKWEVHSFSFTNPDRVFNVYAESDKGPMIIDFSGMIVGVKFYVQGKYPETKKILGNYLYHHLIEITSSYNSYNVSIVNLKQIGGGSTNFNSQEGASSPKSPKGMTNTKASSKGFRKTFHSKNRSMDSSIRAHPPSKGGGHSRNNSGPVKLDPEAFVHSGYASSMKGQFIMRENFINQTKIMTTPNKQAPLRKATSSIFDFKQPILKQKTAENFNKGSAQQSVNSSMVGQQTPQDGNSSKQFQFNKKSTFNDQKSLMRKGSLPELMLVESRTFDKDKDSQASAFGQYQMNVNDLARAMYPDFQGEVIRDTGMRSTIFGMANWIPGQRTETNRSMNQRRIIRVQQQKPVVKYTKPLPKFKEIDNGSVMLDGPYLSQNDLQKIHQKREDLKIIGPRRFVS